MFARIRRAAGTTSGAVPVAPIVAGIIGGYRTARAQITCGCHLVQIHSTPDPGCNVPVCISGMPWAECVTMPPDSDAVIFCPNGGGLVIVDGCGNRQPLAVGGCIHNIPGPVPCCIDACIRVDENGCRHLNPGKGALSHSPCPGG
ncbi:MAG TPA: hypothetical protein VHI13_10335 [Candidatus Kapabacteria bacterium]|nr:hypothetical protein [Candidatus Kapabacteria bacterium]